MSENTTTAKPRVLVADDEQVIANTLAIILNQAGFEARAVYSGEKAIEALDIFHPDMLISDVIMTGMTGIGLLCAAALGGGLAWAGPTGYLVVGVYALYTQWHHPALTTPWIWAARPPHDLGAAICAGLVFTVGMAVFAVRGARDPADE